MLFAAEVSALKEEILETRSYGGRYTQIRRMITRRASSRQEED